MERLRESFRIEREDAVEERTVEAVLRLRERSRTHYQPMARALLREVARLSSRTRPDDPGLEEAEDAASEAGSKARELLAHLSSTANRLVRACLSGGLQLLRELDREDGRD